MWDPAFRDIFAHAGEIKMVMRDIDGGIEVTETSENPAVVPMIRAHAVKVNSFVAKGMRRPGLLGRVAVGPNETRAVTH